MKTIITFTIAMLFAFTAIGQDATSYSITNYGWHSTDTKAWVLKTAIDTMSADVAPDTIISGTDTIIYDFPDTLIILAPGNYGTNFGGLLIMNMDTIGAATDLVGTVDIMMAQCASCPYTIEKTINLPDVDTYSRDTFDLRDIKMQLRFIVSAGLGSVQSWVTLKPAGSW